MSAVAAAPGRRTLLQHGWRLALVVTVAGVGWWAAVHGVAGVGWAQVRPLLALVTPGRLIELAGIWLGGLAIYACVLAAALPGLGVRRGLVLNLSGSAVANSVPLGGAVATAVNWRMVRAWGHSDRSFVAFCVLTNGLDVMTKLLLPAVAVSTLVVLSMHVPSWLWLATGAGAVGAALLAAIPLLGGRPAGAVAGASPRWWGRALRHVSGTAVQVRHLVSRGWAGMLPASAAYVAAQVLLLWACLATVGLHPLLGVVLVAAAVERLGTLVPITPGGAGVAEIGTVAWLVASGLDPASVVAGVLLYRTFLVVMEIPVGGVLLGGWWLLHRRPAPALTGGAS